MAFKITDTRKSAQARGERARFIACEKCYSTEFEETGILLKSIVCAHCGHKFNKGEGAIYKKVESGSLKSTRKYRPGSGARFRRSDIDFEKRK